MGLRPGDLKDLVYYIFEVDNFKSKMGDDKDIITLSFSVKEKEAANDLMNFLEKGYGFVLDADATPGEQSDGTFKVFVEMERTSDAPEHIMEICDGVRKITGLDEIKFRYHKNFRSHDVTEEALEELVPLDADEYNAKITNRDIDSFLEFFKHGFVDNVSMLNETITIKKKWADPLHFDFVDFGPVESTINNISESFNANGFAEIMFLTKYIGDYNITKYGNKLTFESGGNALVLERVIL
jgi:hypothetical protein